MARVHRIDANTVLSIQVVDPAQDAKLVQVRLARDVLMEKEGTWNVRRYYTEKLQGAAVKRGAQMKELFSATVLEEWRQQLREVFLQTFASQERRRTIAKAAFIPVVLLVLALFAYGNYISFIEITRERGSDSRVIGKAGGGLSGVAYILVDVILVLGVLMPLYRLMHYDRYLSGVHRASLLDEFEKNLQERAIDVWNQDMLARGFLPRFSLNYKSLSLDSDMIVDPRDASTWIFLSLNFNDDEN